MKKIAFAMAAACLAVSAQATTVSFNFDNLPDPMELKQTGTLGLFDTSLGTLTGVSFSYNAGISDIITLSNGVLATANSRVKGTHTSTIFFTSDNADMSALFGSLPSVVLAVDTGALRTIAPGATYTSPMLTKDFNDTMAVDLLASLQAAGGGNFSVGCTSVSDFSLFGQGGQAGSTEQASGRCGAAVTYTYDVAPATQVPEPSSLALVGLAIAGLSLVRKARKA